MSRYVFGTTLTHFEIAQRAARLAEDLQRQGDIGADEQSALGHLRQAAALLSETADFHIRRAALAESQTQGRPACSHRSTCDCECHDAPGAA